VPIVHQEMAREVSTVRLISPLSGS
jgi:hypothetical protein